MVVLFIHHDLFIILTYFLAAYTIKSLLFLWKIDNIECFFRVAELRLVWWLDIKGRIETNILSPKSTYGAHFVYKLKEPNMGLGVKCS
ncbi:hypothetical protein FEM48_Zijuj07G0072300 [Ziziphus jujuba var. spinosa]|uniref:Uncharacterized protein n=1 Tax=Ziziphus jujuba var. spinosa TaxID=714518 RepID=A0A978V383_ZIZJJ|nr:hypothetical protein FEM48_Zijuj07G0072300 [Ziziphus jujuba var. spinosa]